MKNELYVNGDGTIAKYVHPDGSETSIKTWPQGMESCGGSGRDKWNVFASCSVGCPIGCKFCFLTTKRYPYHKLTANEVSDNVISAIREELERRPNLAHIPMNLSWMGMGEPWLDLELVKDATIKILTDVSPLVDKFEGVDIGTTLPPLKKPNSQYPSYLHKINEYLMTSGKLTKKDGGRSHLRLFYSLHAVDRKIRSRLIPFHQKDGFALRMFEYLSSIYNGICHFVFIDGINDSPEDVEKIIQRFRGTNIQVRILRFNKCPGSRYNESPRLREIVDRLFSQMGDRIKVQISPGSEISAACGMFIMKSCEINNN